MCDVAGIVSHRPRRVSVGLHDIRPAGRRLAHEIMHARLSRAGFVYSRGSKIRIERRCVKAELLLASRVLNGEAIVPDLEREVANAERLWSTANHHTAALSRLRDLGFPQWLIKVVNRASHSRHRPSHAE